MPTRTQALEPADGTGSTLLGWALTLYAVFSLSSMAAMNLAAVLVFLALLTGFARKRMSVADFARELRENNASRHLLLLSAFLAFGCAVSLIVAKIAPVGYGGREVQISFFADFAKAWYLFWPFVLVVSLRHVSLRERRRALRAWMGTFAFLSVIGLAQYFTGWPRPQMIPGHEPFYHVTLFLGHHLSVASILIFPFFATLDFLATSTAEKRLAWPRAFFVFVALNGLLALLGTYSRMLWAALPVGILLWMILSLRGRARWAVLVAALIAGAALSQWEPVKARLNAGMGIQERLALWQANLDFFKARPVTGIGWRNTEELSVYYFQAKYPGQKDFFVGHAHSNLLEMLGGTGLLGTLAWLAWSIGVLWITWISFRRRADANDEHFTNFSRGLFCAWVVFQLNGLTQVNFWEGKVMHQMAWALAWTLLFAGAARTGKSRSA